MTKIRNNNGGVVIGAIVLFAWAVGATAWGSERDVSITLKQYYTPSIDRNPTTEVASTSGSRSNSRSTASEKEESKPSTGESPQ